MNKKILIALSFLSLSVFMGCGPLKEDSSQKPPLGDKGWSQVSGTGVSEGLVVSSLQLLDNAANSNDHAAFNSIVDQKLQKKLSSDFSLDVEYTEGFSQDTLGYVNSSGQQSYALPYAAENKDRLASLECEGGQGYDSILCYMPRLDAVYGPFRNVFAQGRQLVYTVSSYQNLNTQHILDIESSTEFPYMDQIYLLYFNDAMDRVYVTQKGSNGAYLGLSYFENVQKKFLWEGALDMFFYDGEYIYAVKTDYSTDLSTLYIFDKQSGAIVHQLDAIDIGDRAEFVYRNDRLLVYYVDVSFIEEKESYFVESWDMNSYLSEWKIALH